MSKIRLLNRSWLSVFLLFFSLSTMANGLVISKLEQINKLGLEYNELKNSILNLYFHDLSKKIQGINDSYNDYINSFDEFNKTKDRTLARNISSSGTSRIPRVFEELKSELKKILDLQAIKRKEGFYQDHLYISMIKKYHGIKESLAKRANYFQNRHHELMPHFKKYEEGLNNIAQYLAEKRAYYDACDSDSCKRDYREKIHKKEAYLENYHAQYKYLIDFSNEVTKFQTEIQNQSIVLNQLKIDLENQPKVIERVFKEYEELKESFDQYIKIFEEKTALNTKDDLRYFLKMEEGTKIIKTAMIDLSSKFKRLQHTYLEFKKYNGENGVLKFEKLNLIISNFSELSIEELEKFLIEVGNTKLKTAMLKLKNIFLKRYALLVEVKNEIN